jgi:hypothetical protein
MRVMMGFAAVSSSIFGCMDNDIELSLSAWAFINMAHCAEALSQDQYIVSSPTLPKSNSSRLWRICY